MVALPVEEIDWPELASATTWGRLFSKSSVRSKPVCWISAEVTLVTGLIEMSFGFCWMREPVTTTSCCTEGAGAAGVEAGAVCARASGPPTVVATAASVKRTACRRARLEFVIS